MQGNRLTRHVMGLVDSVSAYILMTLGIFIGFALNAHVWFNWPSWQVWALFLIEFLLFCWWLEWATSPRAIRDTTEEFEERYKEQPHDRQWAKFDATMKRWEENERERNTYD